jgi:hypothetical protein
MRHTEWNDSELQLSGCALHSPKRLAFAVNRHFLHIGVLMVSMFFLIICGERTLRNVRDNLRQDRGIQCY